MVLKKKYHKLSINETTAKCHTFNSVSLIATNVICTKGAIPFRGFVQGVREICLLLKIGFWKKRVKSYNV